MPRRWAPAWAALRVALRVALVGLVIVLGGFLQTAAAAPASPQPSCQFVLGFQTLHSQIPDVVGSCLANEQHVASGDGLQSTTNGLLVWRKSTNSAAFTNGFQTWVDGPLGLQVRLNTQRFDWEKGATVTSTQVIDFVPPRTASQQASGSCFTSSLAATRADAYRCTVGNSILDPCFAASPNASSVVCVRDPLDSSTFLTINLTQPLPPAETPTETRPWFLQLADGSTCGFLTGATGAVNGERLNYGCSDGWDVIGLPKTDTIWTVQEVFLAPRSLNVQKTATVEVATAWQ